MQLDETTINENNETYQSANSFIDDLLLKSGINNSPHCKDLLKVFFKEIADGNLKVNNGDSISKNISVRVAEIDQILSEEINEIIHHPDFQALEATWRNLYRLVKSTHRDPNIKIKILDTTKEEILLDAECAADFDTSGLFKLIYENEYGTFGGESYGLLVSDFEFTNSFDDIECLKAITYVACAAHAPFIASASPELFGLTSFADLEKIRSVENLFKSSEFNSWRTFRSMEESKYVVLTLPKVIVRLPYGKDGICVKEFDFTEELGNKEDHMFVWGSAAHLLAEKILHSFQDYGWFQHIHGFESGGVVTDLPLYKYKDEFGNKVDKKPVQITLTDRRERELENLGFLPLSYKKNGDYAVFFSSATIHKVKMYKNDLANANAHLTVDLSYLLVMSRFAHYLKVIMRDKTGSFTSRQEVDIYLNKWISNYVIADENAGPKVKRVRPLREARVDVFDVPGKPGVYRAVLFARPHYYLDGLTISLRLVSDLT